MANQYKKDETKESSVHRFMNWSGFKGKTLWDWLGILIVPGVLAIAAIWFNEAQNVREQELAQTRYREEVLRDYLNDMDTLILERDLFGEKDNEGSQLIDVAQIKTVTALRNLDVDRRNIIFQFLRDSDLSEFLLIDAALIGIDLSGTDLSFINLSDAKMSGADLSSANLTRADFSDASLHDARLVSATLHFTDLTGAFLGGADLSYADLWNAKLPNADLRRAILKEVNLYLADLSEAFLNGADLSGAWMSGAKLSGADLSGYDLREPGDMPGANLTKAVISNEQLAEAKSLERVIMPDGTLYDGEFDNDDD